MHPSQLGGVVTPKAPSESEQIFSRISSKLTNLTDLLRPLIMDRPETAKEGLMGSPLVVELNRIEERITYLLDHIQI